jgi:hypothetical protein
MRGTPARDAAASGGMTTRRSRSTPKRSPTACRSRSVPTAPPRLAVGEPPASGWCWHAAARAGKCRCISPLAQRRGRSFFTVARFRNRVVKVVLQTQASEAAPPYRSRSVPTAPPRLAAGEPPASGWCWQAELRPHANGRISPLAQRRGRSVFAVARYRDCVAQVVLETQAGEPAPNDNRRPRGRSGGWLEDAFEGGHSKVVSVQRRRRRIVRQQRDPEVHPIFVRTPALLANRVASPRSDRKKTGRNHRRLSTGPGRCCPPYPLRFDSWDLSGGTAAGGATRSAACRSSGCLGPRSP